MGSSKRIVRLSRYFGEKGFPYTTYVSFIHDLPMAHIEDATETVEEVRRVKSDVEISWDCFKGIIGEMSTKTLPTHSTLHLLLCSSVLL